MIREQLYNPAHLLAASQPTLAWYNSSELLVKAGVTWVQFSRKGKSLLRIHGKTDMTRLADTIARLCRHQGHETTITEELVFEGGDLSITHDGYWCDFNFNGQACTERLLFEVLADLYYWLVQLFQLDGSAACGDNLDQLELTGTETAVIISMTTGPFCGEGVRLQLSTAAELCAALLQRVSEGQGESIADLGPFYSMGGDYSLAIRRRDGVWEGLVVAASGLEQTVLLTRTSLVLLAQRLAAAIK